MVNKGPDHTHAASALRHQTCPKVVLIASSTNVEINKSTVGALTGSRAAGMFGRIPVKATKFERHAYWETLSSMGDAVVLSVCTCVDNLFNASKDLHRATRILDDF